MGKQKIFGDDKYGTRGDYPTLPVTPGIETTSPQKNPNLTSKHSTPSAKAATK